METIVKQFASIGARAKVRQSLARPGIFRMQPLTTRIDIGHDQQGEFFDLILGQNFERAEVLNADPADRHLILFVAEDHSKSRFLCGHDETHWFVAAIPESARVSTVAQAKDALQPAEVKVAAQRVRAKSRQKHHNSAFSRQGEWFFLPAPDLVVPPLEILKHERLQRGRARAHMAEFCYRRGGTTVYVSRSQPNGISEAEFQAIPADVRKQQGWRVMVRDAEVFVRGRITHPDHRTRVLAGWHKVIPNTETQALAMRQVAFLD